MFVSDLGVVITQILNVRSCYHRTYLRRKHVMGYRLLAQINDDITLSMFCLMKSQIFVLIQHSLTKPGTLAHLVELSFVCETLDLFAIFVEALPDNLPSRWHIRNSLGPLVVRDDGVGEARSPGVESDGRLCRAKGASAKEVYQTNGPGL